MNSFSGVSPREELLGLVVEVVELALEDRDDVAGDVLADLGVVERPLAAGAWSKAPSRQKVPRNPKPARDLLL